MKLKFLFAAFLLVSPWVLKAQGLEDCDNPCKKTKIVQSGPLIGLRTLTLPDSQYVRVIEVVKHGASHKNGIKLGDTLTHFNGKVIQNMNYFIGEVGKLQPGDTINLTVLRNGEFSNYRFPLGAAMTKKVTEIECCDPEPVLNNIVFVLNLNLTQDYLRVSTDERLKMEVIMNILDANGNLMKTEKTKKPKGNFEANIPVGELPNGVYFVKIYVDNTQYVQRFVKGN
jgi:hypothetical protein